MASTAEGRNNMVLLSDESLVLTVFKHTQMMRTCMPRCQIVQRYDHNGVDANYARHQTAVMKMEFSLRWKDDALDVYMFQQRACKMRDALHQLPAIEQNGTRSPPS